MRGWKNSGKKVLLSVGGQNGYWQHVFESANNRKNFISSFVNYVNRFSLDGVDLAMLYYLATPRVVAQTIIDLKAELSKLGKKILTVSPEDMTIYQGVPVPDPDAPGYPYNYFVPVINLADHAIDYYQPQAYNNAYHGIEAGSLQYFQDVYLNWRNLQGIPSWTRPLPNFAGVSENKLLLGIMASPTAAETAYYPTP